MPTEDKNFGCSLVLDVRIWWRHVYALYRYTIVSGLFRKPAYVDIPNDIVDAMKLMNLQEVVNILTKDL